jgi:hypothetical protein
MEFSLFQTKYLLDRRMLRACRWSQWILSTSSDSGEAKGACFSEILKKFKFFGCEKVLFRDICRECIVFCTGSQFLLFNSVILHVSVLLYIFPVFASFVKVMLLYSSRYNIET